MSRAMLALPRAPDITRRFAMLPCPATATLSVQYYTALSLTYSGEKIAVLIDLKKYGELWEDFYDSLTAYLRAEEPRESLESVRADLPI